MEDINLSAVLPYYLMNAANSRRDRRQEQLGDAARHGKGVYAQPKLQPDLYVGDFDEVPMGLPDSAPCGLQTCCCCLNAGEFETIRHREEPSRAPCCPRPRRKIASSPSKRGDAVANLERAD